MNENGLEDLARDLTAAAAHGGTEAGQAAVSAGATQAEVGFRVPGKASTVAASGMGSLKARVGATQRRGVYQESAPALAGGVNAAAVADTMADVAASVGAAAVHR